MSTHKISSNNDGKCFMKGLLTLKWKYCAAIIINPMMKAGIKTSSGNHTPTINNVESAILVAPIKLLVKSFRPNCLNSVIML